MATTSATRVRQKYDEAMYTMLVACGTLQYPEKSELQDWCTKVTDPYRVSVGAKMAMMMGLEGEVSLESIEAVLGNACPIHPYVYRRVRRYYMSYPRRWSGLPLESLGDLWRILCWQQVYETEGHMAALALAPDQNAALLEAYRPFDRYVATFLDWKDRLGKAITAMNEVTERAYPAGCE